MPTEAAAKPLPEPTRDSKPYWDGLNEGRLLLQQCAACRRIRHYPRPVCDACYSMDVTWIEASGRGRVHSWTVAHHPFHPGVQGGVALHRRPRRSRGRGAHERADARGDAGRDADGHARPGHLRTDEGGVDSAGVRPGPVSALSCRLCCASPYPSATIGPMPHSKEEVPMSGSVCDFAFPERREGRRFHPVRGRPVLHRGARLARRRCGEDREPEDGRSGPPPAARPAGQRSLLFPRLQRQQEVDHGQPEVPEGARRWSRTCSARPTSWSRTSPPARSSGSASAMTS